MAEAEARQVGAEVVRAAEVAEEPGVEEVAGQAAAVVVEVVATRCRR